MKTVGGKRYTVRREERFLFGGGVEKRNGCSLVCERGVVG